MKQFMSWAAWVLFGDDDESKESNHAQDSVGEEIDPADWVAEHFKSTCPYRAEGIDLGDEHYRGIK